MIIFKSNAKKISRGFDRVIRGFNNWKPPLKKTQSMQHKSIKDTFQTSGRTTTGGRWDKLKSSTLKQKLKFGFQTPILVRTGKLRDSFRTINLTKLDLKITSKVPYYKPHQTGTKKMAQRQIAGHSRIMIDKTTKIFQEYLLRLIRKI